MDLGTIVNAVVVAVVGILLTWHLNGRFRQIDRRFDELDHRMDGRFNELDQRVDGRFDEVNHRIDRLEDSNSAEHRAIRADLTQIAMRIGLRPDAEAGG